MCLRTNTCPAWAPQRLSLPENPKKPNGSALRAPEKTVHEINYPASVVSFISDAPAVVTGSSGVVEVRVETTSSRKKLTGVCSLLTSMRVLGTQPARGDCSAKRPKSNKRVVIGLGANVGNGWRMVKKNTSRTCHEAWMRWIVL